MSYVTQEQLAQARKTDLLTYLLQYAPDELVRCGSGVYTTRTHDSLKLSNGKWYWWSRGVGGVSALDYLIVAEGLSLPDAVERICGGGTYCPTKPLLPAPQAPRPFQLPPRHSDCRRAVAYLMGRGIDPEIIRHCIHTGLLYEDAKHHNCVLVGYCGQTPRYAFLRGTLTGSRFLGEAAGSDKRYSFRFPRQPIPGGSLSVFEGAIDALSYLTLCKQAGEDWQQENVLSLSGVYQTRAGESKLPLALEQYLKDNQVSRIALRLDSDTPGRLAAQELVCLLDGYHVTDCPPQGAKDYNELLCREQTCLRREARRERDREIHIKEETTMGFFANILDEAAPKPQQPRQEEASTQEDDLQALAEQKPAPVSMPEAAPKQEPVRSPSPIGTAAAVPMDDAGAVAASTRRIRQEIERITRRNMKDCVAEYLADRCAHDPAFSRSVMEPKKSLTKCFAYINRKAQDYAKQEREEQNITETGIYGCDVPDDLVYQWAVDYFTDPAADEEPRKMPATRTPAAGGNTHKKSPAQKQPVPTGEPCCEQLSLLGGDQP